MGSGARGQGAGARGQPASDLVWHHRGFKGGAGGYIRVAVPGGCLGCALYVCAWDGGVGTRVQGPG